MLWMLAETQSYFLVSPVKPILMLLVLGGWAWTVSHVDKDVAMVYPVPGQRLVWNGMQMAAGVVAFGLWLLLPWFWLGLPVALLILAGGIAGYAMSRNAKVPEAMRWRLSTEIFQRKLGQVQAAQAQRQAVVRLLRPDGSRLPVPSGEDPQTPAHTKLEELLDFALSRKAERIDLAVSAQQIAAVVTVDGVKHAQPAFEPRLAATLMDYVKGHAGLDVEDRRRKQTGTLAIDAGAYGRHTLALTSAGSTQQLTLVLRIDPDLRASVGLGKLGLLESQRQQLQTALARRGGAVLVACPPDSGQTTTLYSLMQEHDPYTQSVVTLEDEVAFEVEGVNHNVIEPGWDGHQMAEKLGGLIRQDPQVVVVGRLADAAMARLIANAAGEMRFYVGLRQDDTFGALKVWLKAVGDGAPGAPALGAVVAQRLVRKLCTTCRTPYKPDQDALRKLNLSADRVSQLYKSAGQVLVKNRPAVCPACLGLAYRGRVGVFEVMALDDQARKLAGAGNLEQLRAHLRKNRMLWLQEAALARVVDGTTSISEITRALGGK